MLFCILFDCRVFLKCRTDNVHGESPVNGDNGVILNGDVNGIDHVTPKETVEDGTCVEKREEIEQTSRTEQVIERPDGSEEVI